MTEASLASNSGHARAQFLVTILSVLAASILLAGLEYHYFQVNGVPSREADFPVFGPFFLYQVQIFFPVLGILSFQPFIREVASRRYVQWAYRQTLALGFSCTALGLLLQDLVWFAFRTYAPIATDPLAHRWILPADPTAYFLGFATILGAVVPIWYIVLGTPIVAVLVALFILPRD